MSHGPVTLDRRGRLAIVTIDNPPVNAAGHAVREGLIRAAEAIAADPEIDGAVLRCAGRTFIAGADITEFGKPPLAPSLRDSCAALEALAKPVVAVLHGTALGGGLELALSCHYRVIDPHGSVGLPEVMLGIIPGAGGTQRLPRLIGVSPALDMMTSGRRVGAEEALRLGVVDATTVGDRCDFARTFIETRIGQPIHRLSEQAFPPCDAEVLAQSRANLRTKMPGQIAPLRVVDVVERSAALAFEEGQTVEGEVFDGLRASPQSRALRHIFFAERAVAKVPGAGAARALERVGIVGGGTMGAGIAAACLLAGLTVHLIEQDDTSLAAGRDRVDAILRDAVKRTKLSTSDYNSIAERRFLASTEVASLGDADVLIEAVFESAAAKEDVFRALDAVAKSEAVLATNTSYLDVAAIAAVTSRPRDVIGLHFFAPAHVMKVVEIVVPPDASGGTVATGFALAKRLGKLGVWAGNREGFIGNRMLSAYRRAADHMVEDGASPFAIDAAFRDFGFAMGLFAMQDLAGLDIGWATRKRLAPTRDPAERYVAISDRICERGWLGRKTARGYYDYEGTAASPNLEIAGIIEAERRAKGITPRPFTADEIQTRVALAMVNEGAKILDEGVALRAGDIDVVMVNGYGYPRWRGGPMHAAEALGLAVVRDKVDALRDQDALWQVAPLLAKLAREGGSFA